MRARVGPCSGRGAEDPTLYTAIMGTEEYSSHRHCDRGQYGQGHRGHGTAAMDPVVTRTVPTDTVATGTVFVRTAFADTHGAPTEVTGTEVHKQRSWTRHSHTQPWCTAHGGVSAASISRLAASPHPFLGASWQTNPHIART